MEGIILLFSLDIEEKISFLKRYFNVRIKKIAKEIINLIMIMICMIQNILWDIVNQGIKGYYVRNVIIIMKRD